MDKPNRDILDKTLDEWGQAEILRRMVLFFGTQRVIELVGWSVMGSLFVWDDASELRQHLEEKGLTESSLYRALRDLRRFGVAIETGALESGRPVEEKDIPKRDMSLGIRILRRLGSLDRAIVAPP